MSQKKSLFIIISMFLLILGLWELASTLNKDLLFVLPAPSSILYTLVESHEILLFHAYATLTEMALGFSLALIASFPLAWMMFRYESSRALLQPIFIIIQCIPMFALAPLMIIWFGWNFIAIVVPTALMIFFPLTLNIYQGLKATPRDYLDFFKTQQATTFQTFFKLRLPWAMPHIFAGFRISAAISGFGAIAGEWAGAQKGLGILMLESRRNADIKMTFASILLLTLMTSSFYAFVVIIETLSLSYKKQKTKRKALFLKRKELIVTIGIFALFLPACTKNNSTNTRILLDWMPNPNHVPLYVGIHKGFFKEEGIDLEIEKMPNQHGGISLLSSHQTELILYHLPGTMRATAQGAHVSVIGALIKEPLISFIYKKGTIHSPHDLSGKTLGYCVGSSSTAFLDYLLEKGNIQPKEKINVSVDFLTALGSGKIDFVYGGHWNIESFQLASLGLDNGYFKIAEFDIPQFYELIVLANRHSKETTPSFVSAFQRALQKSIDYSISNPETAFQIYISLNPDKRTKTIAWEKKAWEVTYPLFAKDQTLDSEMFKSFYHFLNDRGLFPQQFNYNDLLILK